MLTRTVILTPKAKSDLENIERFVESIYRKGTGQAFINKIVGVVLSLSHSAGAFSLSHYHTARAIHPEAKTLSIMKHRWTVVFHINDDYVIIDRILPSSIMS